MKGIFEGIKGIMVLKNESLTDYNSFRIGGNARYLIKVYTKNALFKIMEIIKRRRMRYMILGEGTNVLFSDKGFDGAIIKLMGEFRRIKRIKNIFLCGGGALLRDFVNMAMDEGYGGMEFLTGIPGSIGGAIKGNAGAFGRSISEILERFTILDQKLNIREIDRGMVNFDYRYSNIPDRTIITEAELKLRKGDRVRIKKKVSEFLKMRYQRQPRGFSAGSFFKNPRPYSAGKLIEECGLKGLRIGDAIVSEKHANFIINLGNAKTEDVLKLARIIKKKVKEIKGVELEPEVKIIK